MARRLGIFLCLLGLVAAIVLPLVLNTKAPFGSLNRIEDDLERAAAPIVDAAFAVPDGVDGAQVVAEGRDLIVTLPAAVTRSYNTDDIADELGEIDGVRNVKFGDVVPDFVPTEVDPDPTSAPDPTAEPDPAPDTGNTGNTENTGDTAVDASEAVAELSMLDIQFEPGTATLTVDDTTQLDEAANLLSGEVVGGPIQVQSHSSDEGDPDVNFLLTQDRAEAIMQYLISQGVAPTSLTAKGFGAAQPIADNATPAGRAANERVVLIVEEG